MKVHVQIGSQCLRLNLLFGLTLISVLTSLGVPRMAYSAPASSHNPVSPADLLEVTAPPPPNTQSTPVDTAVNPSPDLPPTPLTDSSNPSTEPLDAPTPVEPERVTPHWDKPRLAQLVTQIQALEADGLNPLDYFLPELERVNKDEFPNTGHSTKLDSLATQAYLLALNHLAHGKVDPAKIDPDWNFTRPVTVPEDELKRALSAIADNHLEQEFQRARPQSRRYQAMTARLQQLRELASAGGWPIIPEKAPEPPPVPASELTAADIDATATNDEATELLPVAAASEVPTPVAPPPPPKSHSLKPGQYDVRVPLLRERMQMAGLLSADGVTENAGETITDPAVPTDPTLYDEALELAVRRFQETTQLAVDGVVGKQSLEQLNVPVEHRIEQLRVNLERERWLTAKLDDYVLVDVAGYRIYYIQGGKVFWTSRVQVGNPKRKTPIFQSSITHLTLNPRWKVPPTILRKDILPEARKDFNYLAKKHIRVFDVDGNELSPELIDWYHPGNITLRQDAGADAALGQLAVRFPNTHSVYLHETPYKSLFSLHQRAFSSGCIRVENIRELAVLLLNNAELWSRDALENVLAEGETREVHLKQRVPILLAYWTVDVTSDGYVAFRPDIYQRDPAVLYALNQKTRNPAAI